MAEFPWDQGWQTAATATDNVCLLPGRHAAFKARFEELGGQVSVRQSWTNGDGTSQRRERAGGGRRPT